MWEGGQRCEKLKVTHFISLDPSNQIQKNMRWWNDCNLKIQNKTIASCLIQIKTKHMDFKLRTCHAKAYIWAPTVFLFCIFFLELPLFTQRTGVVFIYFFSVFLHFCLMHVQVNRQQRLTGHVHILIYIPPGIITQRTKDSFHT